MGEDNLDDDDRITDSKIDDHRVIDHKIDDHLKIDDNTATVYNNIMDHKIADVRMADENKFSVDGRGGWSGGVEQFQLSLPIHSRKWLTYTIVYETKGLMLTNG